MGKAIDFGPRGLRGANGAFLLSAAEWLTIQVYTRGAAGLPVSETLMRQELNMADTDPIAPFQRIIDAYKDINAHCKTWDEVTFPQSVSLAGDVVNYSRMAPTYFNEMLPEAEKLARNPNDEAARAKLLTILKRLSRQAGNFAAKAKDVAQKVTQFANDTKNDQVTIQGADGKGGLAGYYNERFGATSEEGKRLQGELAEANRMLQQAISDYNHNVVVAATTPTYAWVIGVGWIIAPVVAGVFTKKALDSLELQKRARAEIGRLGGLQSRNATVIGEIERAQANIATIQEQLNAALPAILKIQGTWLAMKQDFDHLIMLIDENLADSIRDLPALIGADVEIAIDQWKALGKRADEYRTNAFVQVEQKAA